MDIWVFLIRGRNYSDRPSPNADFRRKLQIFADSPPVRLLEIHAFQGENRRLSLKTARSGRLGSVTLGASSLAWPYKTSSDFREMAGFTSTALKLFTLTFVDLGGWVLGRTGWSGWEKGFFWGLFKKAHVLGIP